MTEPRDELLERYAEAVAQDLRRPSDRVRNATRAHAQMLRDQAAVAQRAESATPAKPAANQPQWTFSLVASLAVVGLAGLMYLQIDRGASEDREVAMGTPAPSPTLPAARTDTAQAPRAASPPASPAPAAIAGHKEMPPSPAVQPLKDSVQITANVATIPAYSAPPAEANAEPKTMDKSTEQLAGAVAHGHLRLRHRLAFVERGDPHQR